MKFALFAAAALFATPALAQTTGGTGTATPVGGADGKVSSQTGQTSVDAQTQSSAPTGQSMPTDGATTMSTTSQTGGSMSGTTGGTDPVGGYEPSQPMPMATGGQQPTFQPGQSVAQAYPAPAPLDKYPVCKKGQYDKCMQRGGK
jgi:hypothetical protein